MTIPTRQQYRYVTVPQDCDITQQIMPVRTGDGKNQIRMEDICFLEEARCERVAMIGQTPVAATIDKELGKQRMKTLASGIAARYGSPFARKLVHDGEWKSIAVPASYDRLTIIGKLFDDGLFLSNPRSSADDFDSGLSANALSKLFDDIKDETVIADLEGTRSTLANNNCKSNYNNYYFAVKGDEWRLIGNYDVQLIDTGWGVGTQYFCWLTDLSYYKMVAHGAYPWTYEWGSNRKEYDTFSGSVTISPKSGYTLEGVILVQVICERNYRPSDIQVHNDFLRQFAKSEFIEASGGSVTIQMSDLQPNGELVSSLGLCGRNDFDNIPANLRWTEEDDYYVTQTGFHVIPLVKPTDFRTDIGDLS